jgi:hypothetical protein
MGRIHMPPSGEGGGKKGGDGGVTVVGVSPVTDPNTDAIYFDVDEDGYFARFADGLFSPDIPDGFREAGSIVGPLFPQVSSGTVVVGFFDLKQDTVYILPIEITPPPTPPKSKRQG